jgi:hypothetical protein
VSPHVTFVIATFKRPDALRCTLRAVRNQTHQNWSALVIGDCCGDDTLHAVRSVGDPRIRYYNLPSRFGEQSGPNSAGLSLAIGDFISFLNHDDLLLPDHLETALAALTGADADFYIGRFADVTAFATDPGGASVPVATRLGPEQQDLRLLFRRSVAFDPSSFWLIRTAYAQAVGAWTPANRLWCNPLRDWLLRAWRRGGTFCFGASVTGLRFGTHNLRRGSPVYDHPAPELDYMIERLEREPPARIRERLLEQVKSWQNIGRQPATVDRPLHRLVSFVGNILATPLYLRAGIDLLSLFARLSGRSRGSALRYLSHRRTGQPLPHQQSIEEFLRTPEAYRLV